MVTKSKGKKGFLFRALTGLECATLIFEEAGLRLPENSDEALYAASEDRKSRKFDFCDNGYFYVVSEGTCYRVNDSISGKILNSFCSSDPNIGVPVFFRVVEPQRGKFKWAHDLLLIE